MTRESPSEYASLAQLTGQLDVFQVGGVEGHSTPPKNTRQARLGDSPGKCRKLARRKGFEPLTPRFEVWCSIQLSYRRLGRKLACCPRAANRRINAVFAPPQFPPSSGRGRHPFESMASLPGCETARRMSHVRPQKEMLPLRLSIGARVSVGA